MRVAPSEPERGWPENAGRADSGKETSMKRAYIYIYTHIFMYIYIYI